MALLQAHNPCTPRESLISLIMVHSYCSLQIIIYFIITYISSATILYNDGQTHIQSTSLNEAISLRSSSTLTLPSGDYTIRSPSGDDSAIRLYMSSHLNATGGDIIGGDATADHITAGAGVIVGSSSSAIFYDGVTVRGGNNNVGNADYSIINKEEIMTTREHVDINNFDDTKGGGQGGDALISQYFGSNVTIYGGAFMAGSGSVKDGNSLQSRYEAQIHIHGGTYYGSWLAKDRGSIVVTGCVNRIGNRLVGRLQNGQSLDVQLIEEGDGKVVLNNPEKCNQYRKKDTSPATTMGWIGSVYYAYALFGLMVCV